MAVAGRGTERRSEAAAWKGDSLSRDASLRNGISTEREAKQSNVKS